MYSEFYNMEPFVCNHGVWPLLLRVYKSTNKPISEITRYYCKKHQLYTVYFTKKDTYHIDYILVEPIMNLNWNCAILGVLREALQNVSGFLFQNVQRSGCIWWMQHVILAWKCLLMCCSCCPFPNLLKRICKTSSSPSKACFSWKRLPESHQMDHYSIIFC